MAIQRLVRPALLLTGGALTLVLTTACQGQFTASGSVSENPTTSNVAAGNGSNGTSSGTGGGGARPATGGSGGAAQCRSGNLRLSIGAGNGAGAGSTYPSIQFTNSGSTACVISGFPGVSYVSGSDGHQVGAPAARSGSAGSAVTLQPGSTASAIVQEANAADFDATDCQPVQVRGLRVYVPGDTAAMYLPFGQPRTACSDVKTGQMSVQTVKAGSGTQATTSAAVSRCHTADLSTHLGAVSPAAASGEQAHTVSLVYTNTSGRTCTLNGFAGVDLRGPDDPNGPVDSLRRSPDPQLSPSDPRYVAPGRPSLVTLTPGGSAHTLITFAENAPGSGTTGSNGSTTWTPTSVVCTPPDETASLTTSWPAGVSVLRQDSATVSDTYIGPIQSGV